MMDKTADETIEELLEEVSVKNLPELTVACLMKDYHQSRLSELKERVEELNKICDDVIEKPEASNKLRENLRHRKSGLKDVLNLIEQMQ